MIIKPLVKTNKLFLSCNSVVILILKDLLLSAETQNVHSKLICAVYCSVYEMIP